MGIFDNLKFDKSQKEYDENYLIALVNVKKFDIFYTLAKGRKRLAQIMNNLSTKKYCVLGIQMLQNVKDVDELMKDLIEDNKDGEMNFGKDEE